MSVVCCQLVLNEKGFMGRRNRILHEGEGIIRNIKWSNDLIAWSNDKVRPRLIANSCCGATTNGLAFCLSCFRASRSTAPR